MICSLRLIFITAIFIPIIHSDMIDSRIGRSQMKICWFCSTVLQYFRYNNILAVLCGSGIS